MASPLDSHLAYSQFIYDLLNARPTVATHTLSVYTIGQTVGMVRGEIKFRSGHTLRIFEQIDFLQQRIPMKCISTTSSCGGMTLCPIPIFRPCKARIPTINMCRLI
jgi:hypothetical protein